MHQTAGLISESSVIVITDKRQLSTLLVQIIKISDYFINYIVFNKELVLISKHRIFQE